MAKKSYRPISTSTPNSRPAYPRLVEVTRRSMVDWSLVAVGAVWLGGAGCQSPLVSEAQAGENKAKPAHAKGKSAQKNPAPKVERPVMGAISEPGLPALDGDAASALAIPGETPAPRQTPDAGAPTKPNDEAIESPRRGRIASPRRPAREAGAATKMGAVPTDKELGKMGKVAPPRLPVPDAGAPPAPKAKPVMIPPPGVPPLPRQDPTPVKQPNAKDDKSASEPEPVRLGGKPTLPRVLEAPDSKKGDQPKKEKARKQDTKAAKP
jgi:hypothetical protein